MGVQWVPWPQVTCPLVTGQRRASVGGHVQNYALARLGLGRRVPLAFERGPPSGPPSAPLIPGRCPEGCVLRPQDGAAVGGSSALRRQDWARRLVFS